VFSAASRQSRIRRRTSPSRTSARPARRRYACGRPIDPLTQGSSNRRELKAGRLRCGTRRDAKPLAVVSQAVPRPGVPLKGRPTRQPANRAAHVESDEGAEVRPVADPQRDGPLSQRGLGARSCSSCVASGSQRNRRPHPRPGAGELSICRAKRVCKPLKSAQHVLRCSAPSPALLVRLQGHRDESHAVPASDIERTPRSQYFDQGERPRPAEEGGASSVAERTDHL
jgi:hypothetical protein